MQRRRRWGRFYVRMHNLVVAICIGAGAAGLILYAVNAVTGGHIIVGLISGSFGLVVALATWVPFSEIFKRNPEKIGGGTSGDEFGFPDDGFE